MIAVAKIAAVLLRLAHLVLSLIVVPIVAALWVFPMILVACAEHVLRGNRARITPEAIGAPLAWWLGLMELIDA